MDSYELYIYQDPRHAIVISFDSCTQYLHNWKIVHVCCVDQP